MATMLSDAQMRLAILKVPNMPDHKIIQAHAALRDIIANKGASELEIKLFDALDTAMTERGLDK